MELKNGQYQIGGVNVLELCKEYGTPYMCMMQQSLNDNTID
jgi:diaminopimelate decarboxylase